MKLHIEACACVLYLGCLDTKVHVTACMCLFRYKGAFVCAISGHLNMDTGIVCVYKNHTWDLNVSILWIARAG